MSPLKRFLDSVSEGFVHSPNFVDLSEIETIMDEQLAAKIRDVASDLSGVFIERLADVLQDRGMGINGRRIVKGFAPENPNHEEGTSNEQQYH